MGPPDFAFEEYKQLNAEKLQIREAYMRVERTTLAGVVIVYGFLLLNIEKITPYVWVLVPFFVFVAAVRSFSLYYLINWKLDTYITGVEKVLYDGHEYSEKLGGYQNWHGKTTPSRIANVIVVNGTIWGFFFVLTVIAMMWRFFCYKQSIAFWELGT